MDYLTEFIQLNWISGGKFALQTVYIILGLKKN